MDRPFIGFLAEEGTSYSSVVSPFAITRKASHIFSGRLSTQAEYVAGVAGRYGLSLIQLPRSILVDDIGRNSGKNRLCLNYGKMRLRVT